MHKKIKETTHEEIGETIITTLIYINIENEYKVCYHNVRTMYLKGKEKKRKYIKVLTTSLIKRKTLPLTKISISYTNSPPKNMTALISKLLPLFVMNDKGQVAQVVITSSPEELASSSLSSS